MSAPADHAAAGDPLLIVCGGGSLPFAVADAVIRKGRRAVLYAMRGATDPARTRGYPTHWGAIGQFGRLCRVARAEGCRDLVFIGSLVRPRIAHLRFDWRTLRILPRVIASYRGGDDHLLVGVARIFESEGFRLLAAHEVAPEILMGAGPLGRHRPSRRDEQDIARALAVLHTTGPLDIGQAAVVANGHVLAVEAAEGTDAMLERVADLRRHGRTAAAPGVGVVVKAPKPQQDRRFDLPAIGPRTVALASQAGLAGIAVAAGEALLAEPQEVTRAADAAGLFVAGVRDDG